jgi:hypothetical protein
MEHHPMSSNLVSSREELMTELRLATQRINALMCSLTLDDLERPVAGLDWNVGETVVHLVIIARRGVNDLRRSSTTEGLAELNAVTISEIENRDPLYLADKFSRTMNVAIDQVFSNIPDNLVFDFHGESKMTVFSAMSVVLGELLIHGNDIAQAVGKVWVIQPYQAVMIFANGWDILTAWLAPEAMNLTESYRIHFSGHEFVGLLRIAAGTFTVTRATTDQEADYIIHIEPLDFIFAFPYGRRKADNPDLQRLCSRFKPL